MKNIKYLVFTILILFLNIFCVKASCTDEEINSLKELAKDIKVTYKHKGVVEDEDGIYYNLFDVKVKNIPNDMYISLMNGTVVMKPSNGEATETFNNGTWYFEIYSNNCNEKIDTIKVFIPRFNKYSLDSLCEGIDGDDFALCGKYYEYDVDYDSFVERVNYYRATNKVKNDIEDDDKKEGNNIEVFIQSILDFILLYRIYILISLLIILIILIIIIVIQRRKKRGVLE